MSLCRHGASRRSLAHLTRTYSPSCREDTEVLIKEWLSSRYPATCPHGRSICYRMEHKDVVRDLGRLSTMTTPSTSTNGGTPTVVLVHGGFVDGSGWQGVYSILKDDGYSVRIVQNPTISL